MEESDPLSVLIIMLSEDKTLLGFVGGREREFEQRTARLLA